MIQKVEIQEETNSQQGPKFRLPFQTEIPQLTDPKDIITKIYSKVHIWGIIVLQRPGSNSNQ